MRGGCTGLGTSFRWVSTPRHEMEEAVERFRATCESVCFSTPMSAVPGGCSLVYAAVALEAWLLASRCLCILGSRSVSSKAWIVRSVAWAATMLFVVRGFVRPFEGKVTTAVASAMVNHIEVVVLLAARTRNRKVLLATQVLAISMRDHLRRSVTGDFFDLIPWFVMFLILSLIHI